MANLLSNPDLLFFYIDEEKTKTLLWLELTTLSSEVLHFVIEPWALLLSLVKPHKWYLPKLHDNA